MPKLSRRDFIKISASALGGAVLASASSLDMPARGASDRPNIIVLLLDAMTAKDLSVYGYARRTTPNLSWIAERSTVFNSHYSGGNFTTSGTASMFTGTYPWTHRAIGFRGLVEPGLAGQNLFGLLGKEYYRLAFSQNALCGFLLSEFAADIDERLSPRMFAFQQQLPMLEESFPRDRLPATFAFREFLGEMQGNPASVSMGYANLVSMVANRGDKTPKYPLGMPTTTYVNFELTDVFAGVTGTLQELAQNHTPFFAYNHLYPPHAPYKPKRDNLKTFWFDDYKPIEKPSHPLTELFISANELDIQRKRYDAYVADVDFEIGLFVRSLKKAGLLDSSYLIITSDHGELFERSEQGHGKALLYESAIKIPLLVMAPGQNERRDVHVPTSNVDLVPTLLSLIGKENPPQVEGRVLPGLGGTEDPERSVFTVFGVENSAFLPLTKTVMSMVKGEYKLIYYRGYKAGYDEKFELYNLKDDPEELKDLIADDPAVAKRLKEELVDTANTADRAYQNRRGRKTP